MRTKFNFFAILCVIAIVVSTTFTSCNKDDDEGGSTDPKDLVGTWKLLSEEEWYKDADGESGHEIEEEKNDDEYWETITFRADGTWYSDAFEKDKGNMYYHDEGTYTTNKNILQIEVTYHGTTKNASYTSNNGVISFDYSKFTWNGHSERNEGEPATFSINGNTLTVTEEYTEDGDWEKTVYIYKRQ